jgi:hypothetical protein
MTYRVVQLFGDYRDPESKIGKIVQDPYYGYYCSLSMLTVSGSSGFEDNFKQAVSFSEGFLRQVLGAEI